MSSAVNGCENEHPIVSGLRIAANLRVNHELFPGIVFIERPVQIFNPCFGSVCRYHTVGVARVDKYSILSSQLIVYVDRSCTVLGVHKGALFLAQVPLGHVRGDVKGVHDCAIVQVEIDGQSVDTVGDHLKFVVNIFRP